MLKVSVVIPCHNGARFLGEAINSILEQRYAALDLIIVDNGSTDETVAIAQSFGDAIRLVREPERGLSHARAAGINVARGDIFAFCDHDDLWDVNRLPAQLDHLASLPQHGVSVGLVKPFSTGADGIEEMESEAAPYFLRHPGAMLIRRAIFDTIGDFGRQQGHDTLEWIGRAMHHGIAFTRFDHVVMHRRAHGDNHSRREGIRTADFARSLKQVLDLRRNTAT